MLTQPIKKKAFSVIEVLLALALIALVAGLFSLNFDRLLNSFAQKNPDQIFHEAIRDARYQASFQGASIYLRFDEKKHKLLIQKGSSKTALKEFLLEDWVSFKFKERPIESFRFGRFMEDRLFKDVKLDRLEFMPDGSSTAAIITLKGKGEETKFYLDPMSTGLNLPEDQSS